VRNFFNGKLFYKLLSVVLAVFFWFYINNQENPITIKTYHVPLTLTDMREGIVVDQSPGAVDVRTEGTWVVMNQLTNADFLASVDLSEAERGAAVYPVQIVPPEGVRVLYDRPLSVELVLDEISGVTLPVQVNSLNSTPAGYSNLAPVATPAEVLVQGKMNILETLSRGQAYYSLEGARQDFSTESPVTLINKDGEEVSAENLMIIPSHIQIQVPVEAVISTRDIPVHPMISGMLQTESLIRTITIEPASVTVTGPQETLSALEQIDTETIDVSNVTAATEFYVSLLIPEGFQAANTGIRASVSVEPVMGVKEFSDVPLEIRNVPFGLYVSYADNLARTAAVTVGGAVDTLSRLEKSELRAFVDLAGLQAGTHMAGVTVQTPEGLSVEAVAPDQIEVILSGSY
jgi:YbbR domain-containing protein